MVWIKIEVIVELDREESAEREAKIPCPLCGTELTLKATKTGGLTFYCEKCKLRAFINSEEGCRRVARIVKSYMEGGKVYEF